MTDPANVIPGIPSEMQFLLILFGIPLFLVLSCGQSIARGASRLHWAATGLVFGLWSLSLLILVPYIGAYPSLAFISLDALLFQQEGDIRFWVTMYIMNLAVWPGLALWVARPNKPKGAASNRALS